MESFTDPTGFNFRSMIDGLGTVLTEKRKREAVSELELRIKRCQELTVYLQSLHFVYSNLGSIDKEEKDVCAKHVFDELLSWGHVVTIEVNTLYDLSKVIVKIQVASIENLNALRSSLDSESKPT